MLCDALRKTKHVENKHNFLSRQKGVFTFLSFCFHFVTVCSVLLFILHQVSLGKHSSVFTLDPFLCSTEISSVSLTHDL